MTTARDGSPVELYARMPTFGEPEHGLRRDRWLDDRRSRLAVVPVVR